LGRGKSSFQRVFWVLGRTSEVLKNRVMLVDTSLSPQDMEIKEENSLLFWGLDRTSMLEPQPSRFPTCNIAHEQGNLNPHLFIGEITLHMQKYSDCEQSLTQCP
jgi:hypothetical protein